MNKNVPPDDGCRHMQKLKCPYGNHRFADVPDVIPAKRAAELVGFSSQRIYALCDQKKIFSVRINDRIFCSKDSVIAHFASVERIAKPFATARYAKLINDFAR